MWLFMHCKICDSVKFEREQITDEGLMLCYFTVLLLETYQLLKLDYVRDWGLSGSDSVFSKCSDMPIMREA